MKPSHVRQNLEFLVQDPNIQCTYRHPMYLGNNLPFESNYIAFLISKMEMVYSLIENV